MSEANTSTEPAVLEIDRVGKSFWLVELERLLDRPQEIVRKITAVRQVSLTLGPGQVYGFLGPNGAGKTTTIKMCMDLIRPTHGSIRLFGQSPRDQRVKRRVGYLPEQPYFYDYLKPQEILEYFGRLFGLDRTTRRNRIDALLSRVGLTHARNRSLRKFSKGMLQRLGVAQALINDPDLLVLDEPLSGLDPMGRKEIRDIIIEERAKGKTIFFSSHIISDIEHLCDRVAIVVNGRVEREGTLDSLLVSGTRRSELVLRGASTELTDALNAAGVEEGVNLGADIQRVVVGQERLGEILRLIVEHGAHVEEIQPHRDSLEALFVRTAEQGGAP